MSSALKTHTVATPASESRARESSYVGKVFAIVWKDVLAELRTKELFTAMFVFALLSIVIFNFAFQLRVEQLAGVVPGVLWVAITFSGVLGLNRSLIMEKDKGSLEGLLLSPVDPSAIYLGKTIGNIIFMLAMEVVIVPIFSVFFNLPIFEPRLALVVVLGTIGFAAVGTLFSAVAVNTKTREVMLPILLFPVSVPVIIGGVESTALILSGKPLAPTWLGVMVAFDVILTIIAVLTFEYAVEE